MSRSEFAALLVLAALAALAGCERYPSGGDLRIRTDMVDQPSFRPQEDPRPLPPGAIPLAGGEIPAQGEALFRIYCTPCHGVSGRGDGPVAAKIPKPADLTDPKYAREKDDFFFRVITTGGVIMPPQAESLALAERRAVVQYLRKLQRP